MNLRAIVGNALHGAASALGNVTQTHQPPSTHTQAKTSAANTGTLTDKQVKEIAAHIVSQRAQPSLFEEQVKQIDPKVVERRDIYDQPVMVELPKSAEKMTKPDYDQAFARALLKKAGMSDAREAEVAKFRNEYSRVTGGKFELTWNEQQLRAYHQQHGNQLPAHTNEYGLAVADAGMRQIHADRQEYAARVEQLRNEAQAYGVDAVTGFYEVQMNGPIILINDATKIVGLPELPKFEVGGEYWKDKKGAAETATTVGAAVLTGGAGLASDLLIIGSSAGNMAEAATGTDFRTGEELTTADRVLRGGSGAAGAYAVRGRVDEITEGVAARVNNVTKPPASAAEAVTAEGVPMRVAVDDAKQVAATEQQMAAKNVNGAERIKPMNLPSWKKITVDMEHIASGHMVGGSRALQSGQKTLFPAWMTREQVKKAIEVAYGNAKRVGTQVGRQGTVIELEGYSNGMNRTYANEVQSYAFMRELDVANHASRRNSELFSNSA